MHDMYVGDMDGRRTSHRETPVVANVGQPYKERESRHLVIGEEDFEAVAFELDLLDPCCLQLVCSAAKHRLTTVYGFVVTLNSLESFDSEVTGPLVELGDVVQDVHSFFIVAAVKQELWRLLEPEDDESEEKHQESDATQGKQEVSPTHVAFLCTTWLTCTDIVARLQGVIFGEVWTARVVWYKSVRDDTAYDNTDGLKDRE
jgi:hypothetical protein